MTKLYRLIGNFVWIVMVIHLVGWINIPIILTVIGSTVGDYIYYIVISPLIGVLIATPLAWISDLGNGQGRIHPVAKMLELAGVTTMLVVILLGPIALASVRLNDNSTLDTQKTGEQP